MRERQGPTGVAWVDALLGALPLAAAVVTPSAVSARLLRFALPRLYQALERSPTRTSFVDLIPPTWYSAVSLGRINPRALAVTRAPWGSEPGTAAIVTTPLLWSASPWVQALGLAHEGLHAIGARKWPNLLIPERAAVPMLERLRRLRTRYVNADPTPGHRALHLLAYSLLRRQWGHPQSFLGAYRRLPDYPIRPIWMEAWPKRVSFTG
ncbi:MAG: hypothetical protein QN120_05240 [Armatimonadota bacterium]|nr:hypothetical protein [Armatimonadota bacterium]